MKIAVASDHAGFGLKQDIADHLRAGGYEVLDLGTHAPTPPVDYPIFCAACARAVVRGEADLGVVVGGSGQGEQLSANKVHGARAALCHDEYTARYARLHNNANLLSIGARLVATPLALDILDVFLNTQFEGGRHIPRLEQIAQIEAEECAAAGQAPTA